MKPLTISEKITMYTIVLGILEKWKTDEDDRDGLCCAMSRAIARMKKKSFRYINDLPISPFSYMKEEYPEMYAQFPKDKSFNAYKWCLDEEGNNERIKVTKRVIKNLKRRVK